MDYKFVYENIIEKAKNRTEELEYYEKHHILPKSLGGSNDENNLVKLTAREHFICHWLLVKMYQKGSLQRNKMLYAFHRMCYSDPNGRGKRKINSKTFEKYRIELSTFIGERNKNLTKEKNSMFGKSWYTNRNTGEIKVFKVQPDDTWIKGRNFFKGESCKLKIKCVKEISSKITKTKTNIKKQKTKLKKTKTKLKKIKFTVYSLTTLEKLKITDGVIPEGYGSYKNAWKNFKKLEAQKYWDEFHLGNFNSLNEYSKTLNITQPALTQKLKKYIPIYKIMVKKRFDVKSDNNLIGKYE